MVEKTSFSKKPLLKLKKFSFPNFFEVYELNYPANIYLFKLLGQWRSSTFFIINCEHISNLFLMFLLTFNK